MGRSGRKASPLRPRAPLHPVRPGGSPKTGARPPSREAPEPRPGWVLPARAPSHLDAPGQGWTRDAARPGRAGMEMRASAGMRSRGPAGTETRAGPGRDGDAGPPNLLRLPRRSRLPDPAARAGAGPGRGEPPPQVRGDG